jgi:hypothetical protein
MCDRPVAIKERNLSYLLRNSGAVIDEAEELDVILHRRDGSDLFLATLDRERWVRESFGIAARLLVATLAQARACAAATTQAVDVLPWLHFLPESERELFIDEFVRTAAACTDTGSFAPLGRLVGDWKATAETYADPEAMAVLSRAHDESAQTLRGPRQAK